MAKFVFKEGDTVLAQRQDEQYWYVGKIAHLGLPNERGLLYTVESQQIKKQNRKELSYHVAFNEQDLQWIASRYVLPLDEDFESINPNKDIIFCRLEENEDVYYEAELIAFDTKRRLINVQIVDETNPRRTVWIRFSNFRVLKNAQTIDIKEITLKNLSVQNLDFFADFEWQIQPQMNVLLGRNGFGKTHLLRLLVAILKKNFKVLSEYFSDEEIQTAQEVKIIGALEHHEISLADFAYSPKKLNQDFKYDLPILAIPGVRFANSSGDKLLFSPSERTDLILYGAYFFLNHEPMYDIIQDFLASLASIASDEKIRLTAIAEERKIEFQKEKIFEKPIFKVLTDAINELTDAEGSFAFVDVENFTEISTKRSYELLVKMYGLKNPFPLQKVSQGTISVLAIFGLIYNFLKAKYNLSNGSESEIVNKKGIVIIDEIDAHLHPTWQRKIIHLLIETFPNVQFIVTAHNPMIVAGRKFAEVAVMQKQEGKFTVKQFQEDFVGTDANTLYEEVFEIDTPDETFLEYYQQIDEKDQIKDRIRSQSKKKHLNEDERIALQKDVEDLHYIFQVLKKLEIAEE